MSQISSLPERVKHISIDGKDVYIVGTAHVSKESVDDVRATIEAVKPDSICVELCHARYKTMVEKDIWQNMNIFKVIREKKAVMLLAQLIMSSFYRKLGEKLGVQPGAEMLEAVKLAHENYTELVLADREIDITLKRVWGYLSFWNKLKMAVQLVAGIFDKEEINAELIEKIKRQDQLEAIMAEFAEKFPEVKKRLLDERDIFLAQSIRAASGQKVVAVVGAGHVAGIQANITHEQSLEPLMQIPPKSIVPRVIEWVIPLLIIGLLIYGFVKGDADTSMQSVYIWILVTGLLSAAGAAIALAHPLAIISAFIAAPITTLNPFLAAGWVAGIVQGCIHKPKVADFEDMPNAISTVKGFWTNPVMRILLVVVFTNLGSSLGTFIAVPWIAAKLM